MRSAVNWAVLGLVIERPSYGYELFQRLERRYGGVLDPPISQIYAALNALERAKLIEPLPPEKARSDAGDGSSARRQPKVHYRATATGARAFREWIAEELGADPRHVELLRRIASAGAAGADRIGTLRALVDDFERACVAEASRLPLPKEIGGATAAAAGELVERLLLAARRGQLDAHLAWVAHARKEIEDFEQARATQPDAPADA